jgi:putative restriction endonuclease
MLTEAGFDEAIKLMEIPIERKQQIAVKSFEVVKIAKKLNSTPRPENYNPISSEKQQIKVENEIKLRYRGFRQAIIEAYDAKCAVCGLKLCTPDFLSWEVEAAHIVPHGFMGKDDIWNGIALCRLHHWAFDVGWFTLTPDFRTEVSSKINQLPHDYGMLEGHPFLKNLSAGSATIRLPENENLHPHINSINWHRNVIFSK